MIPSIKLPTDAWPAGQLHEARDILADLIHHPVLRVMLAARVVIAENVTRFRVERIPDTGKRAVLVDITLELARLNGEIVSLNTKLRPGDAR